MDRLNRQESEMSMSNKFDAKSSHLDRIRDLTLKDVDLLNLVSKNLISISLSPTDAILITKTILRDTEFFQSLGIMDYSILLGVEEVHIKSKESLFLAKIKE